MNDIVQRKMSGYCLNLPEGFKLVIHDVATGERHELNDEYFGVEYYMRLKAHQILKDFNEARLV